MIDQELLAMLRCPIDGIALEMADEATVNRINTGIEAGEIRDRVDQKVTEPIDEGLVTADGKRLYPVRNHVPTLIAEEAIELV